MVGSRIYRLFDMKEGQRGLLIPTPNLQTKILLEMGGYYPIEVINRNSLGQIILIEIQNIKIMIREKDAKLIYIQTGAS